MKRFGSLSRPLFAVMLIFTVFACGGGGCSGCEGCAIAPIPGGFPIDQRIPNSAQVRLTSHGLDFIESEIDTIVGLFLENGLSFDLDRIAGTSPIEYELCPNSDCRARAEIDNVELTPTAPNGLQAHIRIILDSRNRSDERAAFTIRMLGATCNLDIDTRRQDRPYIGAVTTIGFEADPHEARRGYTRLVLGTLALASGEEIETDDLSISPRCSGLDCVWSGPICGIANIGAVKDIIIGAVEGQLDGIVSGALGSQLCTRRGANRCPEGTFDRGNTAEDATCYYTQSPPSEGRDECVPILLGMDGRGDLGAALLSGFAPGTHATGQFVLAAAGDPAVVTSGAEAVNEGMSLFMAGGFMSMDRAFGQSPGHNPCVPVREAPPLPDVARADAFRGNVIPGTSVPTHIGIGVSEDFLDYAGYGLFDSGMLCIGAGTRLSQQLSTGLVSGIVPSVRPLAFPTTAAALTLALRPQYPPDFTIGTDADSPLLNVFLRELQIDWYVWSSERYVRFMTYQTDLTVRINLAVEGGAIAPRVAAVEATNSTVFNDELITDSPTAVARATEGVLTAFAGQLAGSIDPIMLPAIMGFELDIPPEGVRGVASNEEAFLGIFANLRVAGSSVVQPVETTLSVSDLTVDPASMSLDHWGEGDGNTAWLHFGGSGVSGADYEYSYRIDGMTWSDWTRDSRIRIDDDVLLLQARHVIEARARIAGEPRSADPTPARTELIVDVLPPELQVTREQETFIVQAADLVSDESALQYRFRIRDEAWSPWQSSPRFQPDQLVVDGGLLHVEVQDEAGNVSTGAFPLIRGIPNPAGGGCACGVAVGATDRNGPVALLGSLLLLGAMVIRRRRALVSARVRRGLVASLLALPLLVVAQGCDCSGNNGPSAPCNDQCVAASPPGLTAGQICCESTNECASYDVDALCEAGETCPIGNVQIDGMSCAVTCSACEPKPPLAPGYRATDLDFVVGEGGETYVSGYGPGVPPMTRYGDLLFGTIDASGDVEWEIVDGAPRSPIVADREGWRGGVSAPGDDVGRWTSLADSGTALYISYFDLTNGALKMAIGSPGAWETHTVDDAGESGRYSSLVLLEGGIPAVAYLRIEPAEGGTGRLRSSVRIAIASSASPSGETDWTITEIAGAEMACRPEFCGTGEVCLSNGACVVPTSDCADDCGDNRCYMGVCEAALPANYVEDLPPAYGLHVNLARTPSGGLAAVWYDRGQGNLYAAELPALGGAWGAPLLIDGYARGAADAGDSGIGASLFVDAAGTWHVTYVDGAEEALRYASIAGGAVTARETIDNGVTDGMTQHADGRHVVGDDSSVVVTDGGEIRVVYQDATSQHLMLARRAAGGGEWTVTVLDAENHTGFWAEQQLVAGTTSYVATWWRQPDARSPEDGVRVLTVE